MKNKTTKDNPEDYIGELVAHVMMDNLPFSSGKETRFPLDEDTSLAFGVIIGVVPSRWQAYPHEFLIYWVDDGKTADVLYSLSEIESYRETLKKYANYESK